MKEIQKYVTHHETGYPIRIAPPVRNMLRDENDDAEVIVDLITHFPYVGERSEHDFAAHNTEENIRLRRIAREMLSPILVSHAQQWGIEKYCTFVHGSVARGLVRNPKSDIQSDIDITLVVDKESQDIAALQNVRVDLKHRAIGIGVPIDCSVKRLADLKTNNGQAARIYVGGCAYPIANEQGVWEKVQKIAVDTHQFLLFKKAERKHIRALLAAIIQMDFDRAQQIHHGHIAPKPHLMTFLEKHGLFTQDAQIHAEKLYELVQ